MQKVVEMGELPVLEVEGFIRRAGAQRVTERAGRKLTMLLEEKAEEIVGEATLLARHAGRKTVTAKDVLLASELLDGKKG